MLAQLDNLLPWFGDMLSLGGSVLLFIILLAALIWTIILERAVFLWWLFPRKLGLARQLWRGRREHQSWFALQSRKLIISRMQRQLNNNQALLSTLIKICPLLGLLGTVMGMLEIFDVLSVTGNSNARATAGGVSKATVSTMAGMVVAISALIVNKLLTRQTEKNRQQLLQQLNTEQEPV